MTSSEEQRKKYLISQILRLQQDFQALTEKQNNLQHENQYFQNQLSDLENQLQAKIRGETGFRSGEHIQAQEHQQQQWPIYLDIEGDQLPQQPGEFIKYVAQDGRQYVQNLELIQYIQTSPDGRTQRVVRQQYKVVQQPLQMFEQKHGPFSQLGFVKSSQPQNISEPQSKQGKQQIQNKQKQEQTQSKDKNQLKQKQQRKQEQQNIQNSQEQKQQK